MSAARAGVLVDVDGTLLDTNYLHTLAWSRALCDLGTGAPMHAIHRLVGMGGDQLVPELLGRELAGADEAHDRHYGELEDEMLAFPGAAAWLRRLHEVGLAVILASSASVPELARMREVLDAGDVVDSATTGDDVDRSKPDPQIFEVARTRGGIDPALGRN